MKPPACLFGQSPSGRPGRRLAGGTAEGNDRGTAPRDSGRFFEVMPQRTETVEVRDVDALVSAVQCLVVRG
ncbi:hypothetical protein E4N62_27275 [Streptomyces sp. MNU76]|uniref:hypothetical protein n=1 Tax=Streptomyces sp. MNU76 TaxID=2560026 RepID=UPI001E2D688A|nr:hypothetical protein [Streptomyces sp. MNU76]MCC9708639.1 hypothetical protein [Streptomyces sp. MNU76]